MFKVIIAGSRNYDDYNDFFRKVEQSMEKVFKNYSYNEIEIVSGGCRGTDKMAERYAKSKKLKSVVFNADWSLGKKAGPIRNAQMAEYGDMLIAFLTPDSRGTVSMVNEAKKIKLPIVIFSINTVA